MRFRSCDRCGLRVRSSMRPKLGRGPYTLYYQQQSHWRTCMEIMQDRDNSEAHSNDLWPLDQWWRMIGFGSHASDEVFERFPIEFCDDCAAWMVCRPLDGSIATKVTKRIRVVLPDGDRP